MKYRLRIPVLVVLESRTVEAMKKRFIPKDDNKRHFGRPIVRIWKFSDGWQMVKVRVRFNGWIHHEWISRWRPN